MDVRGSAALGCGIGGAPLKLSGRQSDTPGCVWSRVGAAEHLGSGIRVGGVSGRDRSHANFGDSSLSSTTTILDSGPTGLRGGSPAVLRGRSNRFEEVGGITRPARQASQITRPVGLLAPCSIRTQPAASRAARALRTVCWQQPRSSASRRLDGQQESLARAYSSKARRARSRSGSP